MQEPTRIQQLNGDCCCLPFDKAFGCKLQPLKVRLELQTFTRRFLNGHFDTGEFRNNRREVNLIAWWLLNLRIDSRSVGVAFRTQDYAARFNDEQPELADVNGGTSQLVGVRRQ